MSKVKFSEIATITMGQSPKGESCNVIGEGEPLLNGPTEFTEFYPNAVQYTTDGKKYSENGDILFCVRGSTTGRMNISDKEYVLGRGLAAISHQRDKNLNIFVKYLIEFNLDKLLKNTSGSTFPNLSRDILNSFEFNLPKNLNIESTNNLLTVIDKKIELNNKINKELESMVKILYEYWFVQFDFPDENGKPYKSSGGKMVYNKELKREIPDSWKLKQLGDFAQIKKGTLITEKEANTDGNIKVVSAGISFSYYHDESNYQENTITISASGANAGYINFWRESIFACDCTTVRGNNLSETLIILNFLKMRQDYLYKQVRGSAQPHVYPKDIEVLKIEIPSKELIKLYGQKVESLNKKILLNEQENQKLTQLRDWLLPMLMNGQVKVK